METKTFSALYVSRLPINDLYALTRSTIEYASPVKEDLSDLINAALAQMETASTVIEVQMNKPLKSSLTEELSGLDDDRDDRFSEIKRNVSTCIKGRDEVKKSAAGRLKAFLDPYWDTDKEAMNTETGVFAEMLGKYHASESLQADAVTIGITDMLVGLETVNTEFGTLYQTRNTLEATQSGPSASSLKSTVVHSYEQFCTAIEQAVNFAVTDTLADLFSEMDELRKKYATLMNRKDEEEEAPTETAGV